MSLKQQIIKRTHRIYGPKAWYVEQLGRDLMVHGVVVLEGEDKAKHHVVFHPAREQEGRRHMLHLLRSKTQSPAQRIIANAKTSFGKLVERFYRR